MTETRDDESLIHRCIGLARKAKQAGHTPVGSLVVIDGEILIEALEEPPTGPSRFAPAELAAVRRTDEWLDRRHFPDATLCATAEPYFLCTYAVRESRLERLAIERSTPHVVGNSSRYSILLADDAEILGPPPEVHSGTLQEECLARPTEFVGTSSGEND